MSSVLLFLAFTLAFAGVLIRIITSSPPKTQGSMRTYNVRKLQEYSDPRRLDRNLTDRSQGEWNLRRKG